MKVGAFSECYEEILRGERKDLTMQVLDKRKGMFEKNTEFLFFNYFQSCVFASIKCRNILLLPFKSQIHFLLFAVSLFSIYLAACQREENLCQFFS